MTIRWKAVHQFFTVVLFFNLSHFEMFVNFGHGTVSRERVKATMVESITTATTRKLELKRYTAMHGQRFFLDLFNIA